MKNIFKYTLLATILNSNANEFEEKLNEIQKHEQYARAELEARQEMEVLLLQHEDLLKLLTPFNKLQQKEIQSRNQITFIFECHSLYEYRIWQKTLETKQKEEKYLILENKWAETNEKLDLTTYYLNKSYIKKLLSNIKKQDVVT